MEIHHHHQQWIEGREDQDAAKWREGVKGAKKAWWELENRGVRRQEIRMRQSSRGMKFGEGRHWIPFRWAEEPFLTQREWKEKQGMERPQTPFASTSSNRPRNERKRRATSPPPDYLEELTAIKRLRKDVGLVLALAEEARREREEEESRKKGKGKGPDKSQ